MGKMVLLYVPCKNEKEALRISEKIVSEKLCFCTNIIPKIKSVYKWKGKLVKNSESLMICKVLIKKKAKAIKEIKELHSYAVPFIGEIKLNSVNKEYLSWV